MFGAISPRTPTNAVLMNKYASKEGVQNSLYNVGIDTGTADNYIINLTPKITIRPPIHGSGPYNGVIVSFLPLYPNTTRYPNLTINGNTYTLYTGQAGDISQYYVCNCQYSTGLDAFVCLNPQVTGNGSAYAQNDLLTQLDTGSLNAYVWGTSTTPVSVGSGSQIVLSHANSTNTGSATLDFEGSGPQPISLTTGEPLKGGEIVSGGTYIFIYNSIIFGSGGFLLLNPSVIPGVDKYLNSIALAKQVLTSTYTYITPPEIVWDLSAIATITGDFAESNSTVQSMGLDSLTSISGNFALSMPNLKYLSALYGGSGFVLNLLTIGGNIIPVCPSMPILTFPNITHIGGSVDLSGGNTSMTYFDFGGSLKEVGGDCNFTTCILTQAAVDTILTSLAALDGTAGTTSYDGHTIIINGGNAAPSSTGLAAITTLTARGNTVLHN